jgi:transposase-like protein
MSGGSVEATSSATRRPAVSEKLSPPPRSGVRASPRGGRDLDFFAIYTDIFKAKMVQRLSPPNAITAMSLSKEVGVSQSQLSRWLRNARTVIPMTKERAPSRQGRRGSGRRPWNDAVAPAMSRREQSMVASARIARRREDLCGPRSPADSPIFPGFDVEKKNRRADGRVTSNREPDRTAHVRAARSLEGLGGLFEPHELRYLDDDPAVVDEAREA